MFNTKENIYEEKEEIEKVIDAFSGYIQENPYYEILWSDKFGYILLYFDHCLNNFTEAKPIRRAKDLCYELISGIADDVLISTKNNHTYSDANVNECRLIKAGISKYLDKLPEYAYLMDELFSTFG